MHPVSLTLGISYYLVSIALALVRFTQFTLSTDSKRQRQQIKVRAVLYQHQETLVMNIVRNAVVARGKKVLASIHDAIITKEKLGVEFTSEIEQLIRDETDNCYWHLGATKLKRYASRNPQT